MENENKHSEAIPSSDCQYVKEELRMRLQLMYNHSMGIITSALTVWTIATGLLAVIIKLSITQTSVSVICLIFFAAPGFFALPMSIKSGDNLTRVAQLAAYIRVFHEIKDVVHSENPNRMLYESAFKTSGHEKRVIFFNLEFVIITVISCVGEMVFAIYLHSTGLSLVGAIVGYIFSAILIAISFAVLRNASVKHNFMKMRRKSEENFIIAAIEMNVISQEEVDQYREKMKEIEKVIDVKNKK